MNLKPLINKTDDFLAAAFNGISIILAAIGVQGLAVKTEALEYVQNTSILDFTIIYTDSAGFLRDS